MPKRIALTIIVLALGLTGCALHRSAVAPVQGRIIVWHAWSEPEAQVIDDLLDLFADLYPGVRIVRSAVAAEEIVEHYRTRASMGLGPDLLIAPSRHIGPLAAEGLIQPVPLEAADLETYQALAIETLRSDGTLYGLPLSLHTHVLFYNRELADTVPTTLDTLLAEADAGRSVAITTDAYHGFWGIGAFGGRALDEQGRVVLDQGGFANWLGWLKIAQDKPGVFLTGDHDAATALFAEGRVAYYVGACAELGALREQLGSGNVGIAPLPSGPYRAAGPLLEVEALLLNAASSQTQSELALRLARFLTSAEQQMRLARQLGRVPANARVRVDARLLPEVAATLAQARDAVPRLNVPQMDDLLTQGNRTYTMALEGLVTVAEAAHALAEEVNARYDLAPAEEVVGQACELEGILTIWHTWPAEEAGALRQVVQSFMHSCPGTYVGLRRLPRDLDRQAVQEALRQGEGPDLLIGPAEWIARLAEAGLLQDIHSMSSSELTQRFRPEAAQAMVYRGGRYGLPLALRLPMLYYNPERVSTPASTLEGLLAESAAGAGLALPSQARSLAWAMGATGDLQVDATGRAVIDQATVSAWLEFVTRAAATPNVLLIPEAARLREAFSEGRTGYMVGDASHLRLLQAVMGVEGVRLAAIPGGPSGEARTLLSVEAAMVNVASPPMQGGLALAFAEWASDLESQRILMAQAGHIPAHVGASLDEHPAASFVALQQSVTLFPWPDPAGPDPWQVGDALVTAALAGEEVGDLLVAFVDALAGVRATEEDTPPTVP